MPIYRNTLTYTLKFPEGMGNRIKIKEDNNQTSNNIQTIQNSQTHKINKHIKYEEK